MSQICWRKNVARQSPEDKKAAQNPDALISVKDRSVRSDGCQVAALLAPGDEAQCVDRVAERGVAFQRDGGSEKELAGGLVMQCCQSLGEQGQRLGEGVFVRGGNVGGQAVRGLPIRASAHEDQADNIYVLEAVGRV